MRRVPISSDCSFSLRLLALWLFRLPPMRQIRPLSRWIWWHSLRGRLQLVCICSRERPRWLGAQGTAVFRGLYGDPSALLVMRVDCLRTGVDVSVSPENTFVRQTFALASGEVVHASDSGLIGRTVLFGTIDGELTTGMADTDRINADFAGLQPSVTCENAGLALLNPVVTGRVTIRQ